jgi:hypothetical protein
MILGLYEASRLIREGKPLIVAGSRAMLGRLPKGNWIGGTTQLLMSPDGGVNTGERLHVVTLPDCAELAGIQRYGMGGLHYMVDDTPADGFSVMILPSDSAVQQNFVREAPSYGGIFSRSLAGWVSGPDGGSYPDRPQVFHGPTGHAIEDEIVALHVRLPSSVKTDIEIINVYEPGDGDRISFPSDGLTATHALVNGEMTGFADYLKKINVNLSLPLIGEIGGERQYVAVGCYDTVSGRVILYSPVFRNVDYRFAKPVPGLREKLRSAIPVNDANTLFSCVCMGFYNDGDLAHYKPESFEGPVSSGEIARFMSNLCIVRIQMRKNQPPTP